MDNDLISIEKLSSFALEQLNQSPMGLPTGLAQLDNKTRGLKPSELIVIAGRPSMGKTSLATDIALSIGRTHKVVFFSIEMSPVIVAQRMLGSLAGVNIFQLQSDKMLQSSWKKLDRAKEDLKKRKIWFDGSALLTPLSIANSLARIDSYDCVIIDYIQLMTMGGGQNNRVEEVSNISRSLKALARDSNKPFVLLSQLNRQVEYRPNHKPMLSDLRESGSLEQDADKVILLYRPSYYTQDKDDGQTKMIIAKNRNGPTGVITCYFNGQLTRFEDFDIEEF